MHKGLGVVSVAEKGLWWLDGIGRSRLLSSSFQQAGMSDFVTDNWTYLRGI